MVRLSECVRSRKWSDDGRQFFFPARRRAVLMTSYLQHGDLINAITVLTPSWDGTLYSRQKRISDSRLPYIALVAYT